MKNNKQGFTMVELLVVISIMGFIMAAATYSVQAARMKARDTKRIADLSQIRKALDMYFNDNNKYPDINDVGGGECYTSAIPGATTAYSNWILLQNALKPYLGKLPNDPSSKGFNPMNTGVYNYRYTKVCAETKYYSFIAQLEDRNNPNICKYKCYQGSVAKRQLKIFW